MSMHFSDNVVTAQAKTAAKRKTRKFTVIGAIAAVVLVPAAAYAAVTLFGFGDITASATTAQNLTITDAQLTGSLVPGATVGSKGIVHNPNDFAVKVNAVVTKTAGLTTSPAACDGASLHPVGTVGTYGDAGQGWKQDITPVTVPANGAVWVELTSAVSQDASATVLCGFHANLAVIATVGN